jgi:hypothetical protein
MTSLDFVGIANGVLPGEVDWLLWLAAMIDCIGVIAVTRRWGPTGWTYSPMIDVRSPHLALLQRAQLIADVGRLYTSRGSTSTRPHRWEVHAAEANAVLTRVRPYLVAQALRADAALELWQLETTYHQDKFPAAVAAHLAELYEQSRVVRRQITRLTDERAAEIRELKGRMTQRQLAERYGVSPTTIWRILSADKANGTNGQDNEPVPGRTATAGI